MRKRAALFAVFVLVFAWYGRDGVRLHAQTRIAPRQVSAPRLTVLQCTATPISPKVGCTVDGTLYYLDLITPAGKELKLVAVPSTLLEPLDPAVWSMVP